MSDDPWSTLTPPSAEASITARRVDRTVRWEFFWGKNLEGDCLLVLRHSPASTPRSPLPKFSGIEMVDIEGPEGGSRALVLRLVDTQQRDLFGSFCRDIVAAAGPAADESAAVAAMLQRTWRWHLLLRGQGAGRLSPDEQKGLIGELTVLERLILPHISAADAVATWVGPTGAPKDFEIGRLAVESKARRGAATPYVAISSEHQLDTSGVDRLFLHVIDLSRAPRDDESALTVTEVAGRCRSAIAHRDPRAAELFEGPLAASGFEWSDDYSDFRWLEGHHRVFDVSREFPRLTAASCRGGVGNVRYTIDLAECEDFEVEVVVLLALLEV